MNKKLRSVLSMVLCLLLVSASLVACNNNTDDTSKPNPDVTPATYKQAEYNTTTATMPSNWNELTYADNNDTQIMNYIGSSFFDYDYKFENNKKYNDDGSIKEEFKVPSNLYCAVYQEELCGYMAGYAAVKLGYKQLGFLGGMAVPAVVRYGYGFVQGVNAAATELNIADQVSVKYVYGNKFAPAPEITAVMDTWYKGGTEVVFACGGGIYASAAEAAAKVEGAKVIGVDVDQAGIIDGAYGEGMTVTSAMKGLAPTVKTVLAAISADKWADFGGKIETLGLVSENPDDNYVQLAGSTQFADGFTQDDYKTLVASMFKGDIKVDNSTEKMPEVSVKVETFDNIL